MKLSLLLVATLLLGSSAQGFEQVAYEHLRSTYKNCGVLGPSEHCFPKDEVLVAIEAEGLTERLPGVRFFKSKLTTPYFEYPVVSVLVATAKRDDVYSSTVCFSPMYEDVPQSFLALFVGLHGDDKTARRDLAEAVAKLLAEITPQGRAESGRASATSAVAHVYSGERIWRSVQVDYDTDGVVQGVKVINPKADT